MKDVLNKVIDGIKEGRAIIDHVGMPSELYNELTGSSFELKCGEYQLGDYLGYSAFDNPNLLFGVRTTKGHVITMLYDREWKKLRVMVERFPEDQNPTYIAVAPDDVDAFLLSLICTE